CGTANLLFVYRSIGSMQLSRRLGDLEIGEAAPHPLLLAGTIACGLVFGFLLTPGTGDWWMAAALASRPPIFGVTDPVLQRDLGYYLGRLPWSERLRELALVGVCSATVVVALLYVGIGSLRFRRWLPYANAHARAHLGVLLALLALTLTWGAWLDPAESVAGLHGTLTGRTLDVRLAAAPVVAGVGIAATVVTLVWGLRERPMLLVVAWSALLVASLLGFAVVTASVSCARAACRCARAPSAPARPRPGARCTAARRAASGGRSRPSRMAHCWRLRRSRRVTPRLGSARASWISRSPPPTAGRRSATRESRWRGGGSEPPSPGLSRAPRWPAERLTAWSSCGDGTFRNASGRSHRSPRSPTPYPVWPTAPCGVC